MVISKLGYIFSLKLIHNSKPPRGELFMTMSDIEGNKLNIDPRNALDTKVKSFEKMELNYVVLLN